ncbi:hypothetical protein CEE34_08460 [Candidatus Aerophobetes bacterium Ae_b3a]|nr:MAG: hypothetical protein CEE34_08460 [Candidatus Aerophobetes bacterium Ae_b3a]
MQRRLFNPLIISLLLLGGCKHMNMNDSSAQMASKLWPLTGSLNAARDAHTATLLSDGRVLVAGCFDGAPLAGSELYDPTSGGRTMFEPFLRMQRRRLRFRPTLCQPDPRMRQPFLGAKRHTLCMFDISLNCISLKGSRRFEG